MEGNSMLKCIRSSQDYGLAILDSFQYEPIYVFPKNFTSIFKPAHRVVNSEIVQMQEVKCGLEPISAVYVISFLVPDIPDHMLRTVMKEILVLVQPFFAEMVLEEYQTPKSTDRMSKPKKLLKPEVFERLSEQLDSFLSLVIYKLYPYFLYEDEDFDTSSINVPSLSLPIAFGAVGCSFVLSVPLQLQIDMASHVMFHESTVTVHEILLLEQPAGIIKDLIFIFKGFVVAGSAGKSELKEILKIYNLRKMFLRNDSFAEETLTEKVKIENEDLRITLVGVRGLTVAIVVVGFNEGANEYDPWMVAKGKRLLSEMNESKIIEKINEEFEASVLKVESSILDANKKLEIFNNMKKSRSLDSSPIGSPRSLGFKDKKYTPVYLSKHKISVFHYALVDVQVGLVSCAQVYAAGRFLMEVIRPLYCHYANLFGGIVEMKGKVKDSLEIQVRFGEYFDCEKVAVVKLQEFLVFSLYRGSIEGLKQFGYELICVNNKFY